MSEAMLAALPTHLRRYAALPYPAGGGLYNKGPEDLLVVSACAVAWTVLRHVSMNYVLSPLADALIPHESISKSAARTPALLRHEQRLVAKRRKHNVERFAEQAWGMAYCTVFWSIGLTILSRIPNALSPQQVWGTYPCTPIPYLTKWYYLAQLGWWFHQMYAINTEKRRKDYWQMFGHHIISIALISGSYGANYTRVGVIVHVLMDTCDIFLPLAKLLRYMNMRRACDGAFVAFLVTWIITRQVGLFLVIKSAVLDAPKFITFTWLPEKGYYFSKPIYYTFIVLLSLLLLLCSVWFYMAIMVAIRVVTGKGAEDVRSDSEEEDEISVDGDDSDASAASAAANGTNGRALNGNGVKANGVKANGVKANGNANGVNGANGFANGFANGSRAGSSRATPNSSAPTTPASEVHANGFANGLANGHYSPNGAELKRRK